MLLQIPVDITLRILKKCDFDDIQSLQLTCKAIRDLCATRSHWLSRMRNLPRALGPDLPPYVHVDTLSATQLRAAVFRAVRAYRDFRFGEETPLFGERTFDNAIFKKQGFHDMQRIGLLPGGRYLLGQRFKTRSFITIDLVLWDLAAAAKPQLVWSYADDFGERAVVLYGFYPLSASSIRIALLLGMTHAKKSDNIQVLDLGMGSDGTFSAEVLWTSLLTGRRKRPMLMRTNQHITVLMCSEPWHGTTIYFIDMSSSWVLDIELPGKGHITDLQLHGRYMFCIYSFEGKEEVHFLYAVSADSLRRHAQDGLKRDNMIELDWASVDLACTYPDYQSTRPLALSICDYSWTGIPKPLSITVFSFVRHARRSVKHVMASEITLSSSGALVLERQARPEVWPGPSRHEALATTQSGRLFLCGNISYSTRAASSKKQKAVYCIGVDEAGEMYCRFPPDMFDLQSCKTAPKHVAQVVASTSNEIVRMEDSWTLWDGVRP